MTHLRIEQNTETTEEVSKTIIEHLYNIVQSGSLDGTSNLKGTLHTNIIGYGKKQYLESEFDELTITATQYSIDFEDPEVERICIERWGSDGAISVQQMAAVHYLNNYGNNRPFAYNTTITKFNEFQYFTGLVNDDINGTSTGYVFYNCSNLSEITLPDNIPCIGNNMFVGCTSLTSITIPNSVRAVWSNSFSGCTNLTSLTFTGLTGRCDIGSTLTNLSSLTINEGATQLRVTGSSLTTLTVPSTVTQLGLSNNRSLRTLTLSPNAINITLTGQGLSECSSLQTIENYRSDIFTWDYGEFYGMYGLSLPNLDIVVPEGIIRANDACCYQSAFHCVDLPTTVTYISFRAFESCSLTRLIIRATTPPTLNDGYVLDGSYNNHGGCPIYVPKDSISAYSSAQYWTNYASRLKSIEEDLPAAIAAEQAAQQSS